MPTLQSLSQQSIPPPSHPSLPTSIPQSNSIVVKQEVHENETPSVHTTTTTTTTTPTEQAQVQGTMSIPDDQSVVRVKQEGEPLTGTMKVEEEEEEVQVPMETPSGTTSSNVEGVEGVNHAEPTKTEEITVESTSIPTGTPAIPSQETVSVAVDVSLFNIYTHIMVRSMRLPYSLLKIIDPMSNCWIWPLDLTSLQKMASSPRNKSPLCKRNAGRQAGIGGLESL